MRNTFVLLFFISISLSLSAQILEFDQLEMRYDQKQYKAVYRKAKRLLDKPEYDFSFVPRYYLSLSKLQLAQNKRWYKRHPYAVEEAYQTFKELKETHEGRDVLRAHTYELSILKSDLKQWMYKLKRDGDQKTFNLVEDVVQTLFHDVPNIEEMEQDQTLPPEEIKEEMSTDVSSLSKQRENVLALSNDLLGVPYKWAGNTPNGFDCSGFTCYLVQNELGIKLNRRAADQYKSITKVKRKHVKPGDFVFFDNGSGISHVGVIYSTNNDSIQMIHASTSVGISIVDIYLSSYWKKRIAGFGTVFSE